MNCISQILHLPGCCSVQLKFILSRVGRGGIYKHPWLQDAVKTNRPLDDRSTEVALIYHNILYNCTNLFEESSAC